MGSDKADPGANAANFTIDGVNVERGITIVRGKADRYRKILSVFYKEGLRKIDEINLSFADRDIRLYTTYVHALKSASANIGAEEFSKFSEMLESAGYREDWDYIIKHNSNFLSEYKALLENINNALTNTISINPSISIDSEKLSETLRELKQGFSDFESGAINKGISEIRKYSEAAGIGPHIEKVLNSKRRGEFEAAISAIDACLLELEKNRN
ncbi:MAG: Hpt domain-containing protein [Defluviitaleaceae bacterium]|nr:Hpt domain-containing protein [Defluviitaleaceae bacterium]